MFSEKEPAASMEVEAGRGLSRLVWDLRHTRQGLAQFGGFSRASSPLVIPGDYTVRLSIGSIIAEERVEVREDPRLSFEPGSGVDRDAARCMGLG